jgi:hypothetical protein
MINDLLNLILFIKLNHTYYIIIKLNYNLKLLEIMFLINKNY